eukprot:m.262619 g.262619  ORF g.262619 m.262619 type:complete len:103 (+) comp19697_c0_seq81:180-488(+)
MQWATKMAAASSEGHIHFSELNISKFKLAEAAQRVLVKIQYHLLDCQYAAFGKTAGSWARCEIGAANTDIACVLRIVLLQNSVIVLVRSSCGNFLSADQKLW